MTRTRLWLGALSGWGAVVLAGCGPSPGECRPECGPNFVCFYGACVPRTPDADAAGEVDVPPEAPADAADADADTIEETGPDADADVPWEVEPEVEPDVAPWCTTPVGHDEDGDGVDDGCDNCPTYVNPDQSNGDGDGIGDACEASDNPAYLHSIAAFDSFAPGPLTPAEPWRDAGGGTWAPATDALSGRSTPYGSDRWLELPVTAPYSVETRFGLPSTTLSGAQYAGILLGVQIDASGARTWWECVFEWDSRVLSLWWNDGRTIGFVAQSDGPVEGAGRPRELVRQIRAYWDGSRLRCTFDNEAGELGGVGFTPDPTDAGTFEGSGGLRVYNETAEFLSFVLYR